GVAELSKKRVDSDKNWTKIVEASQNGDILEGKITSAVKGGLVAIVDSVRVFIPASQSGVPMGGDLNALVGTTARLKVNLVVWK
ncbi:MAG: bifunctional 4-hydroxy-3-methylbut-2-enyl diphosphate reductase/30S ribosomal protein S1, partial [Clostridia bacterium]|nr:bifunctional 4-hydroxy-3-methylbut-2-enyl diphosphate reductase/30S ribosomal protein S1 [Clostridia bacterium]